MSLYFRTSSHDLKYRPRPTYDFKPWPDVLRLPKPSIFSYDPSSILRIFIWYPQLWAQNFKGLPTLWPKTSELFDLYQLSFGDSLRWWMFSLIFTPSFYRNPTFLLITSDLYRNSLSDPTAKQLIISSTILDTFTPHSYSFLWTFLYKRGSTSRDTFSLISSPVVRTSDSKVSPVNPTGEVSDQEECSYLWAQGSGVLSGWHLV